MRDLPPRVGEADVDGLATGVTTSVAPPPFTHPNGAIGLDHVVIVTPAFDRTAAALDQAGLTLRRIRRDDVSAAQPDDSGAVQSGEAGCRAHGWPEDEVGSQAGGRPAEEARGFRQGFRRLGPAIMEIVEAPATPPGPARFWGLVVVVADLEALRERLHPRVKEIRPAVQPGRQIATLAASAGLGCAVAFMDPP